MTFQLSASAAVNGFRLSAPRTATRRLPPYRPDASPWVARTGIADDRRSTRTRPRIAVTASLRIRAHPPREAGVPLRPRLPPPSSSPPSSCRLRLRRLLLGPSAPDRLRGP